MEIGPAQILALPALWISLTFHEMGHAWAAFRGGDDTASLQGRYTLNPLSHIDPIGTVLIPIVQIFFGVPLIGWAKPVPIDPSRLRNRRWILAVSLSGVTLNLLLAIGSMFIIKMFLVFGLDARLSMGGAEQNVFDNILLLLNLLLLINLVLMLFNLLPIPPLDGSHVLEYFIRSRDSAMFRVYQFLGQFGFLILLGLVFFGVIGRVLFPLLGGLIAVLAWIFQVPGQYLMF